MPPETIVTVPPRRRRRMTIRVAMFLVLLLALALGGYGEIRRQLAAKALVESLSTPMAGDLALEDVRYFHAEKTAARWLADAIRGDREERIKGHTVLAPRESIAAMGFLRHFGQDGKPAVPELIQSAKSDPSDLMQRCALQTLADFLDTDDRVYAALVDRLKAPPKSFLVDDAGRATAVVLAFTRTRSSSLVPILVGLLEDRDRTVQDRAIFTLSMMRHRAEPAIPALVRALRSPNPKVRGLSVRILSQIGPLDDAHTDAIRQLDGDGEESVRHEIRDAAVVLAYRINVARQDEETRRLGSRGQQSR